MCLQITYTHTHNTIYVKAKSPRYAFTIQGNKFDYPIYGKYLCLQKSAFGKQIKCALVNKSRRQSMPWI